MSESEYKWVVVGRFEGGEREVMHLTDTPPAFATEAEADHQAARMVAYNRRLEEVSIEPASEWAHSVMMLEIARDRT